MSKKTLDEETPEDKPPAREAGADATGDGTQAAGTGKHRETEPSAKAMALRAMKRIGYILHKIPGAVTSPTGLVIIFLLLVYAFAPLDRLQQYVESKWQDHVNFDQSSEGLIVVDTPQLFTRERLINERLEESAWIESQLDNVNDLLRTGKFAQADSVSVTQSLLSVVGKNGTADLQGADFEKLGALADKLGTTQPTPLQQFRDAKNYRERLSLQRYDSILDDAHDIGSNTLHRMNFRLTLSPARKRSDSVAAVSITVSEPSDSRLLFDHYGRLMVETRKKMEETVENLLRDRMLILTRDFQFQTSELELIDDILKWKVIELGLVPTDAGEQTADWLENAVGRYIDQLVNRVLQQQHRAQIEQARAYLYTLVSSIGIPSLVDTLMPNYPQGIPTYWDQDGGLESYARNAPLRMLESCGAPFKLTNLSPADFALNSPAYFTLRSDYVANQMRPPDSQASPNGRGTAPSNRMEARQSDRPQRTGNPQQQGAQAGQQHNATEGGQSRTSNAEQAQYSTSQPDPNAPPPQLSEEDAARQLRQSFVTALDNQFTYPCPTRENQITLAKLRLIGRLDILERVAKDAFLPCNRESDLREELIAFIGSDVPTTEIRQGLLSEARANCPGSDLFDATLRLAEILELTRGEYAQIGVVRMMQEKLTNLQLDTSSRTVKLGKFFVFDVARCDLKICKLQTQTRAEAMRKAEGEALRMAQLMPLASNGKDLGADIQPVRASAGDDSAVTRQEPHILTAAEAEKARILLDSRVAEAGREEALRLFLELRCFADARSYTVWPRAGERLASYEQDSVKSGARFDFDSTLQKFTGLQTSNTSDTVMRQERDHIFGIGDWGSRESPTTTLTPPGGSNSASQSGLVPCSRELEAVLDSYEINGTFLDEYKKKLTDENLGPEVSAWWKRVDAEFRREDADYCDVPDCELTMEILMQIAQRLKWSSTQTKFSWIIAPRRETPLRATRHVPMSVPLSALISLPSWWGHAELNITTCWVRPKDLKDRIPTGNLCEDGDVEISQSTKHTLNVPLPGKAQDVLQRIGFFIIRTPYLDTGWNQEEEVEAGRPARIRLTGSRLWKNPRVRIGNQWHDRIEVLPNMQGVIASFNCVAPTLRPDKLTVRMRHEDLPRFGKVKSSSETSEAACEQANAAASNAPPDSQAAVRARLCRERARPDQALYVDERQAEIWTSEGRTSPTVVKVHAFRPRFFEDGEMERPCWLDANKKNDLVTGAPLPDVTPNAESAQDDG